MTRKTYHIRYPRDFINEFYLVAATTDAERAALRDDGFRRLTRKSCEKQSRAYNAEIQTAEEYLTANDYLR